jgi:L-ascorbate metabolism protein UlaG (beta-lactamase superfamily)
MIILFITLAILVIGGYLFMQQKQFGTTPKGERLQRILASKNYRDGSFQNISETPVMTNDGNFFAIAAQYFKKVPGKEPEENLPSIKTNLNALPDTMPQLVWFGHSSYLIKINGKHILVDPVFSGNASPVSLFAKSFKGSNIYSVDDMPELDVVLITHDHYDHLDYETVVKLNQKAKHFVTSLGVGAHLEYWGIVPSKITELDWWEHQEITEGMHFTAAPARHFSGRKFKRGETLWASYILNYGGYQLFLGGDSGYDTHFKEIGKKFGPFDLAILECGQYNKFWSNIHMMPEETVQAAKELHAKVFFPVHNSKFTLALHGWKESLDRVAKAAQDSNMAFITPLIGEVVKVNSQATYAQRNWWINAK